LRSSRFFAPYRHPIMQSPHSTQPVRSGPAPPKNGSGTVLPGSPKNTPTGVRRNVPPTPMSSATDRITSSDGVIDGCRVTPSIFEACA
jgi:hypothetical protein